MDFKTFASTVEVEGPLKQGLKLGQGVKYGLDTNIVEVEGPLKQGLKLFRPDTIGSVSRLLK